MASILLFLTKYKFFPKTKGLEILSPSIFNIDFVVPDLTSITKSFPLFVVK